MVEALTPIEVFCCYSHADEPWLRRLEIHLALLQRQGLISLWYDRLIVPGTDWANALDKHLETASVILLLVSADFFASDYCYGVEMKRALERQESGEALVLPILVHAVDWKDAPFAHLQMLPTDAIPLATWSDQQSALANVAAGIRRVVEDMPLLTAGALRTALPKIWNIPYSRNPFFLGRETELAQVRQRLQASQTAAVSQPQAISGLGGIGKTQLALEYCYRYHQNYQAVLWARADSIDTFISSYSAIASLLQLPEQNVREQDAVVRAVKTWLQTHRGWLLILDNADELALLTDFLPPVFGGHLLLTTRAVATGRLAHRMEIETLLPEQGALFLLRRAALLAPDAQLSHANQEERELALQISEDLGGLPLALDQAGAYLEETGANLADYWQTYQKHRADLLRQRGGVVHDHPASVVTTWSISFQQIEEKNPAAANLLSLCAFLSPDAIPEEILTAGASSLGPILAPVAAETFQLNWVLNTLRSYSLIRRNPKEKTLSIHRLVQAVLQDRLGEEERRTWKERAMLAINAAFPEAKHETRLLCERLLPQAMAAAQGVEGDQMISKEAGRLLYETASYLRYRARYAEAKLLCQSALRIREQQLGPEHPEVAYPLNDLAILFHRQGRYAEAEPLYRRALHIREQQLGPEHLDVAFSLNNLAILYWRQGKYAEAEPLYRRALYIREKQLGPEHPEVAYPLNGLANLYTELGKYAEADLAYQRALHIREQHLVPEHPQVAETMHDLAHLREVQGNSEAARALCIRALAVRERALGAYHPKTEETRTYLIALLHKMGQHEEAAQLEAAQREC